MLRTLRSVLVPALIGFALLALLGLAGSVLVLLREASAVHPVLGWATAAVLALAVCLLVVVPVVRVARLPRALARPSVSSGPAWDRFVRRYARRLAANPHLAAWEGLPALRAALSPSPRGAAAGSSEIDALEAEVERAVAFLDMRANQAIARHAAAVFTVTAVSQSGRLDAAVVLSTQARLVKEVAEIYVQRPHWRELVALYANVGASAFAAGEIQDSELLAILGAPVSAGITSFIPVRGMDPLVSLLVTSLLDGSANAFLTLRVGAITRRYCGVRVAEDRRALARSASLEAAGLMGGVVGQGATRIADATRRAMQEGAVRGTARAARGVRDLGAAALGKLGEMVGKAGASTGQAALALAESLRFWEKVAEKAAAADGITAASDGITAAASSSESPPPSPPGSGSSTRPA